MGPGAFRRLVAVVAPQVLPRALAHQGLERAVEVARGGLARQRRRQLAQHERIARAARQPPRVGEKARDALALGEPSGERHGVSRAAEELGPFALAYAGHLVGQEPDRLAAPERGEYLAHAGEIRRHEADVRPLAAFAHQRLEPPQPGRAVEHRDRHSARCILRGDFEAAQVRREKEQRLAALARGIRGLDTARLAYQGSHLFVRPEPQRRQLGEHLPGGGNGGSARARVRVTCLGEIGAQGGAIGGRDPIHRPAETLVKDNLVVLAGEITSNARVNYDEVARRTIRRIGYTDPSIGFDTATCTVLVAYGQQSADIARGVDEGKGLDLEQGAGDQGLMFGYACDETPSLMPLPIFLSHRLVERQAELRRNGRLPWLRPDAKSQVTIRYSNGRPDSIDTVVLSTLHAACVDHKKLSEAVIEEVIKPVLPSNLIKGPVKYLVNPTGAFEIGGPKGDCGVTGRKIIVDTYGGSAPHGGGAFSGKDPSKVDRSAAYAARYVAKNIVAAGLDI